MMTSPHSNGKDQALGGEPGGQRCGFTETHWSLVLAAGRGGDTTVSQKALERLCASYHPPLYFYLRRRGLAKPDAEDLTQGFFAHLLSHNALQNVIPGKAKFRSFLLKSLNNYLADQHDHRTAQKRGGGHPVISLDAQEAERCYQIEPRHMETPEKLYERQWAMTLIDLAFKRLEQDFQSAGKQGLFIILREYLVSDRQALPYAEAAAQVGMSEGAFKKAVQRIRERYREAIRHEIAQTVTTNDEIEEEWNYLRSALSS